MLQIRNIAKTYQTGDLVQRALDDVSLDLRDNEFVAILGPSGSGKTTLLNIIGGLDRCDEGDLIINGISTRHYKDRDWDSYRNHAVGFIFQSYNLIPHQTILSNVELALTIAGISRKQRRKRALKALEEVGLKEQAHKKPAQMSGGQMQRVAIARALVNDPDILLADEPTGALDSKTSIQVMELLKQVARDRLVVMVTHNPDLARDYANRIVNLKDGKIVSDSNPFRGESIPFKETKTRRTRMSFLTALSLSFRNLLSKKSRTILTSFAGSIGIIGIALIMALSNGFQNYIDKIQEDTMSSYPLTVTSETADAASAILTMVSESKEGPVRENTVRERRYLTSMFSSVGTNDLRSLKDHLDTHVDEYKDDVTFISYSYSVQPQIYVFDAADKLTKVNPSSLMSTMYSDQAVSFMSSFSMTGSSVFSQISGDIDSFIDQYDVLAGRWPQRYDEMILVLSQPDYVSDLLLYSLGFKDTAELKSVMNKVMAGETAEMSGEAGEYAYEELMNVDLRLIKASDTYSYNVKYNIYEDMSGDEAYMKDLFARSEKLKITGIVCPKKGNDTMALSPGIAYTRDLTLHVIDEASRSAIVRKQLADRERDVFSDKRFDEENKKDDQIDFNDMISIDEDLIREAFRIDIDEDSFNFEMMDEKQMKDIVMKAAQTAADMIANTPDATMLTGVFTLINTSYLQNEVDRYNEAHLLQEDGNTYLILDQNDLNEAKDGITGKAYKKFAKEFLSANSQYMSDTDLSALTEMITDKQYSSLAKGVASMFSNYYETVSSICEENKVAYQKDDNDTLYTGTSQLRNSELLMESLRDPEVLQNTSSVVSGMINDFTVLMIASQIGSATAQIVMPMSESLSSLSELFSGDLFKIDTDKFAQAFHFNMGQEELSRLLETMMAGNEEKTLKGNLTALGWQDPEDPTSISFYFTDFDGKENFLSFLDRYNDGVEEEKQIRYTDITGILMSSVKTIVNVVTYVLIAFVSISLVVSSIMIAVITLISVLERTKEIGILRAMGASKRNVSSIFFAETFIIGLLSGLIGVGSTFAAIPFINRLIHSLTDNYNVNAVLPAYAAVALVLISVVLTVIAGFIPSKKAARQDPVIALRSE